MLRETHSIPARRRRPDSAPCHHNASHRANSVHLHSENDLTGMSLKLYSNDKQIWFKQYNFN